MIRRSLRAIMHDPFAHLEPATRRWVRRVFWTIALTLILALSASALFATALNVAPGYRQKLETFASAVLQRPLRIGDLALRWHGWYPSLDLLQVELLTLDEKKSQLQIDTVRLGFSPWRLVFGDYNPVRIELAGLDVWVGIAADGGWSIRGLEALLADSGESSGEEILKQLARFEDIALERCTVQLQDLRLSPAPLHFGIERVELSQGLRGPRLDLALALPEGLGEHLNLRARMRGALAEPKNWNGDWSAEVEGLASAPWIKLLNPGMAGLRIENGQLRINGAVQNGEPAWADLQLSAAAVRAAPKAQLHDLRMKARIAPQPFGWRADIQSLQVAGARGVWPSVQGEITYAPAAGAGAEWSGRMNFLRLEDLTPWLTVIAPDAPAWLRGLSGDLRNLDASLRPGLAGESPRYSLRAALEHLALAPFESSAGFSGLTGELALDENGGHVGVRELALTLKLPGMFAQPLAFESLTTDLRWKRAADGWDIDTPQFSWLLAGSQGAGQLGLKLPNGAPAVIALKSQFSAQDAVRLKPFMPLHWSEGLRQWLGRGLVRVPITKALLVMDGPLADFPYDQKPGLWSLDVTVADAIVDYAAGWPAIKGLNAQLAFRGNGLAISAHRGAIADVPIEKVEARFRDFNDNQLLIDGQLSGELARFYAVLAASPLRSKFDGLFKHTQAQGLARLALRLDIPLHNTDHTLASGKVAFENASLMLTDINEPVRELRGEVAFGADGISARKLEGRLLDQPLSGSITPRKSGSALAAFWVLDLGKDAPLTKKLPEGLRARISGNTALRAQLRLSGPDQAALVLDSDLRGLTLRLPAPLAKAAATAAPMRVLISQDPGSGPRLAMDWSGRFGADLRWRASAGQSVLNAITLRLGKDAPVFAETLPGLSLGAVATELSIDDWSDFLDDFGQAKSSFDNLPLTRANLRAARWLWRGFVLPQTLLRAEPEGQGNQPRWRVRLDGEGAEGDVLWTRERVTAQLAHLALARNPNPPPSRESKAVQEPARWPELDVQAGQLDIGEAGLGSVQLQTLKVPGGQKLTASSHGGENQVSAGGLWLRRDGRSSANLSLRLLSSDFEGLQRAFGFGATLSARASRISTQAVWAPSATGLAWQQARGDLSLEFDNGALRGIEPGVGRVLGLFNFYALPRRLSLNFGDVSGKGLAFDTVRGNFALAEGQARTEDVEVRGPALHIKMRGRAGLVARDYDQHVTVFPGLSTGFTIGAAVLAGPIGAGLVFLAQQILDQPLEKLTQINYRVTGSWDDPQVSADHE